MVFDIVHLIFSSLPFSLYSSSWWKTRPHVSLSRYAIKYIKKTFNNEVCPGRLHNHRTLSTVLWTRHSSEYFQHQIYYSELVRSSSEILVFPQEKYQGFSW